MTKTWEATVAHLMPHESGKTVFNLQGQEADPGEITLCIDAEDIGLAVGDRVRVSLSVMKVP